MSKKKSGRMRRRLSILFSAGIVAGGSGYLLYHNAVQGGADTEQTYKEETVRRGSVSIGIRESGTVQYGMLEQTFELAEEPEVSDTSGTAAASDTASAASGTDLQGMGNARAGSSAVSGSGAMSGSSLSSASASAGTYAGTGSGSASSGTETALEVEAVYIASGQKIEKGDKLLKITDKSIADYRAKLEAAVNEAEVLVSQEEINLEISQAEAEYTYQTYLAEGESAEETYEATITSLKEKIADLEEQIEEEDDEEEREELEAELKIAENNLATGSIQAKQTYENAMTNYKYADRLYEIDTNGLEDDLNEAKDTLESCEENLEEFEAEIGDGFLLAEYSGTVSEAAYAAGDTLINGAAVMTCTDEDNVTMTVSVAQQDIPNAAVGDAATVYLTAYEGEPFAAEVSGIATTASAGSQTVSYDVTVKLAEVDGRLYSGMTGEVNIAGRTEEDTLYISNKAVHLDGARSWVKVLDEDGTIRETDIKTGFSNGKTVAVESGLEEGQTVLIESKVSQ